jgi:hypothetical protein
VHQLGNEGPLTKTPQLATDPTKLNSLTCTQTKYLHVIPDLLQKCNLLSSPVQATAITCKLWQLEINKKQNCTKQLDSIQQSLLLEKAAIAAPAPKACKICN